MVVMALPAAPPVGVWTALGDASGGGGGYLSFYRSDPLARYPIRHVTKNADNKSDPNIETATYGLFSTCERLMRGKIVRDGRRHLFFVTRHKEDFRVLAGYYHLAWFAESTGGTSTGDYALAATRIRFIDPVPLHALPEPAKSVCVPMFRTMRPINPATVQTLREVIDQQPDITDRYLAELRRIEQAARFYTGYAYPSWGRSKGFSWGDAERYLGGVVSTELCARVPSSGRWNCVYCRRSITSRALLKSCPLCQSMGTLRPEQE